LGLGILFLIIISWFILRWIRNRALFVQLYTNGLARVQGSKVELIRWDDIRDVRQSVTYRYINGGYFNSTHKYTVRTIDNRKLTFDDNIAGIHELGRKIQQEVTHRLLPQMISAYESGETLNFGPFSLDKQGLKHKDKSLAWTGIEDAQVRNGYVTFRQQGLWSVWLREPVSRIPNPIIFIALIRYIVEKQSVASNGDRGQLIARYFGNQSAAVTASTGAVLFVLGIGAVIAAIAAWGQVGAVIAYLAFAVFLLRYGSRILWQWWQNRGVLIEVYDEGFVRAKGTERLYVRWDDIRGVWRHINVNVLGADTHCIYTIEMADDGRIVLGEEITDVRTLGDTIQDKVHAYLLPKMLADYERGKDIVFGAFVINKEGVAYKQKSMTWAELEGIQVHTHQVIFKKQGASVNWVDISADDIPNLPTFLALIDHIVGLKRGI
jgi:hypothetical protein